MRVRDYDRDMDKEVVQIELNYNELKFLMGYFEDRIKDVAKEFISYETDDWLHLELLSGGMRKMDDALFDFERKKRQAQLAERKAQ